jgi:hypothetical protein
MRRLLRPLWLLLATIFLIEAWLWDRLAPVVRRIVDAVPWRAFKVRLAAFVDRLSPPASLVVFAIPALIYFGMELIALWPLAHGRWFTALVVLAFAKIAGAAMTAFAFDVTRDKLLQMGWFRKGYETVMRWRDLAHALAAPWLAEVRARVARLRARNAPFMRFLQRLRRRTLSPR